jgi:hypothetical protein
MTSRRIVAVVVLAVVGTLQLWDSHVFSAGGAAITVATVGVSLPIATLLFVERMDVRMAAVFACALLLLSAKLLAPHPLPAIGIVAVAAAAANWLAEARPAA